MRLLLLMLLAFAMLVIVACGTQQTVQQPANASQAIREVALSDFEFSPASITVQQGDAIRFVNNEGSHTVTFDALGVDKTLKPGESVTIAFDQLGTFELKCRFHLQQGMIASVQVAPKEGRQTQPQQPAQPQPAQPATPPPPAAPQQPPSQPPSQPPPPAQPPSSGGGY